MLQYVGTGMGLQHSGDVANAALYAKAEIAFVLLQSIRDKYHIWRYWRYFDDIFIILDSTCMHNLRRFFSAFKRECGYFRPELEEVSQTCVSMLNMEVYAYEGKAYTRVKFKATSLGTPLSWSSSHPPHVHMGWPISTLKSAMSLCSTPFSMLEAGNTFIQRFKSHNGSEVLITKLTCTLQNLVRARKSKILSACKASTPSTERDSSSWVVLPYHLLWSLASVYQSIFRWLNSMDSKNTLAHAGVQHIGFRLAYRNCQMPAYVLFNQICITKGGRLG
jgi:hypothetical protein